MMKDIYEYIKLTKHERQSHLDLNTPCIERGGMSTYCKGLLAHVLDTTIPSGKKIHVCHACHNAKCSNFQHLYWGTASENRLDATANGKRSIWQVMVDKYGEEQARQMQKRDPEIAKKAGLGNKGKSKSPEHKIKIAEAIKRKHKERRN